MWALSFDGAHTGGAHGFHTHGFHTQTFEASKGESRAGIGASPTDMGALAGKEMRRSTAVRRYRSTVLFPRSLLVSSSIVTLNPIVHQVLVQFSTSYMRVLTYL